MKERIEEFLKRENKTYIQFAQEIGVQPSSISHILSGRNKPSLDFVIKMLSRYKYISPTWLLFGKGDMYNEQMPTLFDNEIQKEKEATNVDEPEELSSRKKALWDEENNIKESAGLIKKNIRKPARRIIIFYDDNTFDEYFSD